MKKKKNVRIKEYILKKNLQQQQPKKYQKAQINGRKKKKMKQKQTYRVSNDLLKEKIIRSLKTKSSWKQ